MALRLPTGSGWAFRERAQLVARDAAKLQAVASARAQLDAISLPIQAVSYAAGMGVSTTTLDNVLQSVVPYEEQLAQATASIAEFPDFSSPTLRDDVDQLQALSLEVAADTVSYADVTAFVDTMKRDIDELWYQTYDRLLADISAWRSPGSFGVDAATLIQTYQAFNSGGRVVGAALVVLLGVGDADARQQLIQADGVFQVVTDQFAGHLSPRTQAVWEAMQAKPANQQFTATIQQASQLPSPVSLPPSPATCRAWARRWVPASTTFSTSTALWSRRLRIFTTRRCRRPRAPPANSPRI